MLSESLLCLALNIYYEARGEPLDGQFAVAEVTLRRVADSRWPDTVCDVVYQPHQFEWTRRHVLPPHDEAAFALALSVAKAASIMPGTLKGAATRCADHFHSGPPPRWARWYKLERQIGGHYFYCSTQI
jgi:N-acetylmuramoyl-L-alanine amidase